MGQFITGIIVALIAVATVAALGLIFALPVMLLWDWLMPALFGLGTITWLQAWGLLVLCGMLFKTSGSSGS